MIGIPGMDLKAIYLGAGHVETGGAQVPPLSEGRENIQVVEDALRFLSLGPARMIPAGREYDLGDIALVVLDHGLDLAPSIRAVNTDCASRGIEGWNEAICIEVHHNWVQNRSAAGPTSVYSEWAPSQALGDIAAYILGRGIGIPCKRWTNEQNLRSRGFTYMWIRETDPLALICEMEEMNNPSRARIIGSDKADDLYGWTISRLLRRLAGVESGRGRLCRGMHLGWGIEQDYAALKRMGVYHLVTCHAWQIEDARRALGYPEIVWRPWLLAGWLRRDPETVAAEIVTMWEEAGRPGLDDLQVGNEPNLLLESGYPDGSDEALERLLWWWPRTIDALPRQWQEEVVIHSPPLSPALGGHHLEWYAEMGSIIERADILNLHTYGNPGGDLHSRPALDYKRVVEMYPGKSVCISEFGYEGHGDARGGQEIVGFWDWLEPWIDFAAPYLYNTAPGTWDPWRLYGTGAVDELYLPEKPEPPGPSIEERLDAVEAEVAAWRNECSEMNRQIGELKARVEALEEE